MLQAGQTFAHFKIVRLLGEGGMGQVYLAEDQKLHRQVALKLLTWKQGDDDERLERFQREAKTAAQVSHPNVMAIYDIDLTKDADGNDITYIVMEYIKGKSLADYMKTRQGDIAAIVRLSEKIASGLAAAHKINVVHRDIKADNILVDEDDQPKILDFGLAKPVEPVQFAEGDSTRTVSKELTRAGKIVGTVSYMSPEQIRGEAVDTRSDIFSFGVLLYRSATGEFPFSGPTEVSTLAKILEARHESIRLRNEAIPLDLERIVDKCLQKDPNDRYQDTRDLVVDLRNLRRMYDSGISDTVSMTRETPAKRKSFKLGWKSGLLTLLVLALVWKIFFGSGVEVKVSRDGGGLQAKENSLAILEFENKTGDPELDWLETGLPEMLLTDLAQRPGMNLISRQRITEMLQANKVLDQVQSAIPAGADVMAQVRREVAEELGATNTLSGTFYKMGNKLRIDARLEESSSGRVLMGEKVIGDDPFMLVDSLTDKIASSMNVTLASGSEQDIRNLTSSSPEAYKQYVLGMDQFGLGNYEAATKCFERAITLDSTFALPYMRIGMTHAFQQHPQEAARFLAKALQYQSKLPVRERSLLDVYADIWLNSKFDDAFTKMRLMVSNYPDDIEARTIYGILVHEFTRDSAAAFAQFDTVLSYNPTYQLPMEFRADAYVNYGMYEQAIRQAERIKELHPDSPGPYNLLGIAYLKQGKRDKAVTEFEQLLAKFPTNKTALGFLIRLAIYKRDFAKAEQWTEKYTSLEPGNLYNKVDYYDQMAGLMFWQGRFRDGLRQYEQMIQAAEQLGDSSILSTSLKAAAVAHINLEMSDSGIALYRRAYDLQTANMFSNYSMVLVEHDRKLTDSARKMFREDVASFKSRTPSELWGVTDGLEKIFNGLAAADTVLLLDGYQTLIKAQRGGQITGNHREMAYILIARGEYQAGIDILQKLVSGEEESAGGFGYPLSLYHLGKAFEGLGKRAEAKRYYTEMLKYWGNADIQFKEIRDTKERLAKLTS